MGKLLDKIVGEAVGGVVPGGKVYYKALSKGVSFLNKVISNKKSQAEKRKLQAEARLSQLKSINFQGLQNAGTDTKETSAQTAVFGGLITDTKKGKPAVEPVAFEELDKDGKPKKMMMENKMEWAKKNWYYIAGGVAVLYYLFKKKR